MAEYKINYTQSNFTGGIIAAELYGRNDFNKVKTGLKTCTNWTIREAGGLEFRRGTKYINTVPKSDFKLASIDKTLLFFCTDGIRYLDSSNAWQTLNYPSDVAPNLTNLHFTELNRRLYYYDGNIKLCEVVLSGGVPSTSVTKFESAPTGCNIAAVKDGTDPDITVNVEHTYTFSLATGADSESIRFAGSATTTANVELTKANSGADSKGVQVNVTITLTTEQANAYNGGKILIYKKHQGYFYFLSAIDVKSGETSYTFEDIGSVSVDLSRTVKTQPNYLSADGTIEKVNSVADYSQRLFLTRSGQPVTEIIFSEVGNVNTLAHTDQRNSEEAGNLELPITHYDSWCKVVSGLDLILSTSYTVSKVSGYGDLQTDTILWDGLSKTVEPVKTRRSLIYTNASNRNIYDLTYNEYGQYDSIDLTLLVKYIFETKTIKRLAFKDYPVKTIYVLCDDGDLYCLTYIKDQNIYAWYQIKHTGKIHDLLVINKDTEDEIYMVVETDRLRYTESYDWHEGVGENEEKYKTVLEAYNSSKKTYHIYSLLDENNNMYQYGFLNELPAVGDKAFLFRSVEQVISGEEPVIVTDTGFTVSSVNYNSILKWYEIELSNGKVISKTGSAPKRDCVEAQTDGKGIVVVKSTLDKSLCLPDQAEKVVALYESGDIKDYIVLDENNNRFWGKGYTVEQVPDYIIEQAYPRTKNIYMDCCVEKPLTEIINNKITGLDIFEGKKVRIFDTGNNLHYGDYDIKNPKTVVEGGKTIEIDDLDFNGYLVTNGEVQLPTDIELKGTLLVGLPYYAVAETIPLEFQDSSGNSTIGRKKIVNDAYLRFGDSRGITYKVRGREYKCDICDRDMSDNAQFLERGQVRLHTRSEYRWDSTIKIIQREPHPARIESITLGLTFNDKS